MLGRLQLCSNLTELQLFVIGLSRSISINFESAGARVTSSREVRHAD